MKQEESDPGIYAILEKLLKKTTEPLTCVDLFDHSEVRSRVQTSNRVSDYLAHMWRRGLLQRWTAPSNLATKARFAYTWKAAKEAAPVPDKVKPLPEMKVLRNPLSKPNILVTEEDDRITIELEEFSIIIQSKKGST